MKNRLPIAFFDGTKHLKKTVDFTSGEKRKDLCTRVQNAVMDFTLAAKIEIPESLREVKLTDHTTLQTCAVVELKKVVADFSPMAEFFENADDGKALSVIIHVYHDGGNISSDDASFVKAVEHAISAALQSPIQLEICPLEEDEDGFNLMAAVGDSSTLALINYILRENGYISAAKTGPSTENAC